MPIEVFDTVNSFVLGKLVLSSGSADVKSQSSSATTPLRCGRELSEGVGELEGLIEEAKLKMEAVGGENGIFNCWGFENGDGCRGVGADRLAKGSEGCCECCD